MTNIQFNANKQMYIDTSEERNENENKGFRGYLWLLIDLLIPLTDYKCVNNSRRESSEGVNVKS